MGLTSSEHRINLSMVCVGKDPKDHLAQPLPWSGISFPAIAGRLPKVPSSLTLNVSWDRAPQGNLCQCFITLIAKNTSSLYPIFLRFKTITPFPITTGSAKKFASIFLRCPLRVLKGHSGFSLICITKAVCGTHLTSCLGLIREHKDAVLLLALSSYPIRLHTPERSQSSSSSLVRKGPYKHRKKHMETIKEKILNEKKIENPKRKIQSNKDQ